MAPADLLGPLEGERENTIEIVEGLDAAALDRIDSDSGWTVRQLLAHLASAEMAVTFVLKQALDGELVHVSPGDRDAFNQAQVEGSEDWDVERCVSELRQAREDLRAVFAAMSEEDLDRAVRWPEWPARTIRTSIPYMLEHEHAHQDQLRAALGLED